MPTCIKVLQLTQLYWHNNISRLIALFLTIETYFNALWNIYKSVA